MLRRSPRLKSSGYYDSDGHWTVSYKETLQRIFKNRRAYFELDSSGTSNSDSHSDSYSSHSENWTRNDSDDENNSNRRPSMPILNVFGFLFITFALCFGCAYLRATLRRSIINSGPPYSPGLTTNMNADMDTGSMDTAKLLKELQDSVLMLEKKINHLFPDVDTLPNFALATLGATVLFERTSASYETRQSALAFLGIPLWQPPVRSKIVIQGQTSLVPGYCWPFAGERGHLSLALSHPITISHVTLGHISKNVAPTGTIKSAPKDFSVYGMKTLDDEGTLLGTFLYDQDGDSMQTFEIPDHKTEVFKYVRLQVESNWGHPDYTCLYSFRVHGRLAG